MQTRVLSPVALLLFTCACATAESAEQRTARMATEATAAHAAIDSINVRYEKFMEENLADSVAALFLEDGVMMPPNLPAKRGRAAIREYVASQPVPPGTTFTFKAVNVHANGPIVIEHGTHEFSMPAMDGQPAMSVKGKYLVHWHLTDGKWLQKATIWNDDAPMAPVAEAGAAPATKKP